MITHLCSDARGIELTKSELALTKAKVYLLNICEVVFNLLTINENTEPRITELKDRNGELFWKIYDFRTQRTIYCMTVDEVMEWLDSRHYRQ